MSDLIIEPSGRSDEWVWQVRRRSDGVVVGLFRTRERAEAWASENAGRAVA